MTGNVRAHVMNASQPAGLHRPARLAHRPGNGDGTALPFAEDSNGNTISCRPAAAAGHMLITGGRGTGLTTSMLVLMLEAARSGADVRACGPAGQMNALRGWPGIRTAAGRSAASALIGETYQDVYDRLTAFETGDARRGDYPPILLAVDDLDALAAPGGHLLPGGDPAATAVRQLRELLLVAPSAGAGLLLAAHHLSRAIIGVTELAQFHATVMLGATGGDRDPCQFDTGRGAGEPGAGMILTARDLTPARMHWLPSPSRYPELGEADRALLTAMLPPGNTWTAPAAPAAAPGA